MQAAIDEATATPSKSGDFEAYGRALKAWTTAMNEFEEAQKRGRSPRHARAVRVAVRDTVAARPLQSEVAEIARAA